MISPCTIEPGAQKARSIIDLSTLPCISLHEHFEGIETREAVIKGLPRTPAIYFVEALGRHLYIGQTSNLLSRMRMHEKWACFKAFSFVKVYWLQACNVSTKDRRELERQLIRILRPQLNKLGVWHGRSTSTEPQYQLYGQVLETLASLCQALGVKIGDVGVDADD